MRRLLLLLLAVAGLEAPAQTLETGTGPATLLPFGARSDVFVLDADGGTLRAGPVLVEVAPDGSVSVPGRADAFDPGTAIDARVYSVDARDEVVVVGLGFSDVTADADQPPLTAAGFAVSTDGGLPFPSSWVSASMTTPRSASSAQTSSPSSPPKPGFAKEKSVASGVGW